MKHASPPARGGARSAFTQVVLGDAPISTPFSATVQWKEEWCDPTAVEIGRRFRYNLPGNTNNLAVRV